MFKKLILVLSLLVAMPGLANAWSVTAKAMTTGGTISPTGIQNYGSLVLTAPFTVTASSGKVIDRVTIDSAPATATAPGVYTVNKGTASFHTILVYFKAAAVDATVSITQPVNGSISATYLVNNMKTPIPSAGIPAGATVEVTAMPATTDYKVATLTANGTAIQGAGPFTAGAAVTRTFTAVTGANTVSAAMEVAPIVRAATLSANKNTTTVNGSDLILDATASVAAGTPVYTFNVAGKEPVIDYNLVDLATPVNGKKIFIPLTAGTFDVTVTVTSGNAMTSTPAFTITALTNVAVQNQVCTNCHNGRDPQLVSTYTLSGHAIGKYGHTPIGCEDCHFPVGTENHPGAINTANIISLNTNTAVANKCAECHKDTYTLTTQVANYAKSSHATSTHMSGISCGSCHGGHQFRGATLEGVTGDCQTCHTPGSPYGIYSSNGLINAKHFNANVNNTAGGKGANIASYVASAAATNCSDCHGHNNVINGEYAKSGHGNMMGAAWEHYDFEWRTPTGKQDYVIGVLSADCNRCHTTTGFKSFVASGFTTLSSSGVKPVVRETLYCTGCHTSAEGALKTVAAFTGNYNYNSTKTGPIHLTKIYTDYKESNVCIPCHSGRGTAEQAKAAFAFDTFTSAVNPFSLHHAQPAGLISGDGAYNFTSGDFTYQDRQSHRRIGLVNYKGTGSTQGPCVGCHLNSAESHTLEAATKDANGVYTGIVAESCKSCHPSTFTYQDLNTKKAEFDATVKVLGNLITSKGLTNDGRTPMKWFKTGEVVRTAAVAEKNMGAFINYNIVTDSDKALWLHNPALARRIVYDSIDWLDDSTMNTSAVATIAAQATAGSITATEKAKATTYTIDPGCMGCHFGTGGVTAAGLETPGIEQAPHYNNGALVPGQTFTQAQFIVQGTQCNNCHGYGHGSDSPGGTINKDYAESQHGSINGLAWTDYDFKNRATCVECHTTKGFVNTFGKTFTAGVPNTILNAWGDATDTTTKQVLACNACHSSTAWKTSVRMAAGGVTVPMGIPSGSTTPKSTLSFADVGESNVCIPCHASRENGESLVAANLTNAAGKGFVNPHYLGAAAVFYGKGGFQFYSSGVRYNTYGAAGKTGKNANWSHGKLGMDNYSGSGSNDLAGKSNNTGNKGQCVACHLGTTNTHTFGAAEVANATLAGATNTKTIAIGTENGTGVAKPITRTCYGCHQGNADNTVTTIEAFIEEEVENWNRMFDFFKWQLAQYNIVYGDAYPYFTVDPNLKFDVTVGTTFGGLGVIDSNKTRGAAMNLKLLLAEKGSPVHNRNFGRALIADSITYLQKGDVGNRSTVYPDQNQIIKFSDYSAARPTSYPGQVGPDISITTLKSYLTKSATGGYVRR